MKAAIVGFGRAGYGAAKALRRQAPDAIIHVYSKTGEAPGNPMLTSYYAQNRVDDEGIYPLGDLESICRDLNLVFRATPVLRLDPHTKTVFCQDGTQECYDTVLVATGAVPLVPKSLLAPGYEPFVLRTYGDMRRIKAYLENNPIKEAVVVGCSWVGIKIVEVLHARDVHVTMVDAAGWIFPTAAYRDVAEKIHQNLRDMGIELIFDAPVAKTDETGVTLGDGRFLPSDFTCLSIGIRPDLGVFAENSPEVGRGIVVNERMESSIPGIFAAGDCCEVYNPQTDKRAMIGLWAAADAQGTCAGINMAGGYAEYPGEIPHNITHFFDMDFVGMGDPTLPGRRHSFCSAHSTVEAVTAENGKLQSINILQGYRVAGFLKNHLTKQLWGAPAALSPRQKGQLLAEGYSREFIDYIGGDRA